jgi:hypothetical protein
MPEFKHPFKILDTPPNPVFRMYGTSSIYVTRVIKEYVEKKNEARSLHVLKIDFDPETNTGYFCYEYPTLIQSMYELETMYFNTYDYSYKVSFTG